MRSAEDVLPNLEIIPIPPNCPEWPPLVQPVQDLVELLAEIAVRRLQLHKQNQSAPSELEH